MEEKIQPIRPQDIIDLKKDTIPEKIIAAFNELIATKWNGGSATIRKDELLDKYFSLIGKTNDRANREILYNNHSLDIEDIYRKEGWKVEYSSPTYGDSDFEPYYKFSIKK